MSGTVPLLKLVTFVNDATMLATAVTPLIAMWQAQGRTEVTEEELAEGLKAEGAKTGASIDHLDATIARLKAAGAT
jgi:hypothetical protein